MSEQTDYLTWVIDSARDGDAVAIETLRRLLGAVVAKAPPSGLVEIGQFVMDRWRPGRDGA